MKKLVYSLVLLVLLFGLTYSSFASVFFKCNRVGGSPDTELIKAKFVSISAKETNGIVSIYLTVKFNDGETYKRAFNPEGTMRIHKNDTIAFLADVGKQGYAIIYQKGNKNIIDIELYDLEQNRTVKINEAGSFMCE